ncbi:hypothetical protein [Candidatus Halobonum tyrrellensis]|uniref:Uncharacterized protein n=1 Tax=Candidatus Halobonum tyrrellensis G22 TaxID=1324957 RepID=V4IWM8_9EURY|nr:hypothetical protein [Candidatus Halobonum tyrrellensis]ESP87592.1 hypothetical protein K933_13142 [Candidatus Halobonum tyrrellensis G22]
MSAVPASFSSRTLLRDWVAAAAVLGGLYALAYGVQFQPLQVPGYLLLVGFDAVEFVLPEFGSSTAYDLGFACYLGVLAALAAVGASAARARGATGPLVGVGAGLAAVGTLALLLGAVVYLPVGGTPLAIVAGTGLVLALAGAGVAFGLGRSRST